MLPVPHLIERLNAASARRRQACNALTHGDFKDRVAQGMSHPEPSRRTGVHRTARNALQANGRLNRWRPDLWSSKMTNPLRRTAMSKFNIAEAKARFSELVKKAMLGEEVIIAKDNKPVLKLVPFDRPRRARKPGSGKGQLL